MAYYNINPLTDKVTKIRRHHKYVYLIAYKDIPSVNIMHIIKILWNSLIYISENLNFPCHSSSYKKVLRIKSVETESGCKRRTFWSRLRVLHKVSICIAYIRLSSEYNLTNQFEFKFVFKIQGYATFT